MQLVLIVTGSLCENLRAMALVAYYLLRKSKETDVLPTQKTIFRERWLKTMDSIQSLLDESPKQKLVSLVSYESFKIELSHLLGLPSRLFCI